MSKDYRYDFRNIYKQCYFINEAMQLKNPNNNNDICFKKHSNEIHARSFPDIFFDKSQKLTERNSQRKNSDFFRQDKFVRAKKSEKLTHTNNNNNIAHNMLHKR